MEKQTPMEMELDFEQLDSDLRHLSPIQRQEVLAAESFGNFPPKTRAKHAYLTEKLDAGQNVFSVPAGVIAALLEQAYDTKQNRADFKSRVLQVHPDYAKHWVSLPKSQVKKVSRFCLPSADGRDLEFPVPGEPGTAYLYWIRVSDDPRTQYVFLTPIYARFLLSHSDDRLHTFFLKVHDEVRKMIRGENSVFAVAAEAAQPCLRLADDEHRLKLRRLEYELARDEAQLQTQTRRDLLDQLAWQMDFLKEIDAWDDRAKLHLKESRFNAMTMALSPTTARALLTNGSDREERLEISQELIQLGKRPFCWV